jgi:hypothetical protein
MRTLTIQRQSAGPLPDAVAITAQITPRNGDPFYVCNPYAELREAWSTGELFEGHAALGMTAHPVLLNPAHIVSIREV